MEKRLKILEGTPLCRVPCVPLCVDQNYPAMLVSLSANLEEEAEGNHSLIAPNQHSLSSVLVFLATMRDIHIVSGSPAHLPRIILTDTCIRIEPRPRDPPERVVHGVLQGRVPAPFAIPPSV